MPRHDIHNQMKVVRALDPKSITTDTTTVGTVVDLRGFEGCEFVIAYGLLNDADLVPLIEESLSNDVAMGDATAVADGDLLGTEAAAGTTQATPSVTKKIGYRGSSRYVRLSMVSTSTVGANLVGAVAVLGGKGNARTLPDGAVPG